MRVNEHRMKGAGRSTVSGVWRLGDKYRSVSGAVFSCTLLFALLALVTFAALGGWLTTRPLALAQSSSLRFAVIGDFGTAGTREVAVSTLVKSWNPELVITTGDNNYPVGGAATIDQNIGQYYSQFIYPYVGTFPGALGVPPNRFFPTLGNHDVDGISCTGNICTGPYFDYFALPGNERYYDFVQGPVHFFMLNSDQREPDGITSVSLQATWLRNQLAASTARWKVVVFHHSPYSSSTVNSSEVRLRWPFAEWGASLVLTGHNHNYERLLVNGFPYIVNGSGGTSLYPFATAIAGSLVRYSADYGAMLVDANEAAMTLSFYNSTNQLIDSVTLPDLSPTPTPPATGSAEVRILQGSDDIEEQVSNGVMVLNSTDLELIEDVGFGGLQRVGLRFLDLNVPQGALITNAYLEFIVDEIGSSPTNLTIQSHATDDAPLFASTRFDLSARSLNGPSIVWSDLPAWEVVGEAKRSPNISVLVQEVVNRAGWRLGNAMSFVLSGSGTRTAFAYDGNRSRGALFHVDWSLTGNVPTPTETPFVDNPTATFTITPIPATATFTPTPEPATATFTSTPEPATATFTPTPIPPTVTFTPTPVPATSGIVNVRVNRSSDDVEQATGSGVMYLGSADLEFGRDIGLHNGAQIVGIRFQSLNIPRGATITNAYMDFVTVDADNSKNANYVIRAHASDNSPSIGLSPYALSSRALTSAQSTWSPGEWKQVNEVKRSTGLRTIVQEIVNRTGWSRGNAISFAITGGPGRRAAYSYDLSPSAAPLLHIEWSTNTAAQTAPEDSSIELAALGPQLIADYGNGAPGSIFKIFGSGYPVNVSTKLWVNDKAIASLLIDTNGEFAFELPTDRTHIGTLTIFVEGQVETRLLLDLATGMPLRGPLQESEESAIGKIEELVYLPVITK